MTGLFVLVLLISIPTFFWSLFKPQTFQPLFKDKLAENNISRFFCYLAIISFVSIVIITPANENNNNQPIVQPDVTSQKVNPEIETQSTSQAQAQQKEIEQTQQNQQPVQQAQKIQQSDDIQTQQKTQSDSSDVKLQELKPLSSSSTKPSNTSTYTSSTSCGEDYYRNSDGICVHSPSDNQSGATAKCRDGSYSYSLHRRGTCSGHGGVAVWY